jgi:hypothetical protein
VSVVALAALAALDGSSAAAAVPQALFVTTACSQQSVLRAALVPRVTGVGLRISMTVREAKPGSLWTFRLHVRTRRDDVAAAGLAQASPQGTWRAVVRTRHLRRAGLYQFSAVARGGQRCATTIHL